MIAHYGVDNGLDDPAVAKSYEDNVPYTPAWQEKITGVNAAHVIQVAREFADNGQNSWPQHGHRGCWT